MLYVYNMFWEKKQWNRSLAYAHARTNCILKGITHCKMYNVIMYNVLICMNKYRPYTIYALPIPDTWGTFNVQIAITYVCILLSISIDKRGESYISEKIPYSRYSPSRLSHASFCAFFQALYFQKGKTLYFHGHMICQICIVL